MPTAVGASVTGARELVSLEAWASCRCALVDGVLVVQVLDQGVLPRFVDDEGAFRTAVFRQFRRDDCHIAAGALVKRQAYFPHAVFSCFYWAFSGSRLSPADRNAQVPTSLTCGLRSRERWFSSWCLTISSHALWQASSTVSLQPVFVQPLGPKTS